MPKSRPCDRPAAERRFSTRRFPVWGEGLDAGGLRQVQPGAARDAVGRDSPSRVALVDGGRLVRHGQALPPRRGGRRPDGEGARHRRRLHAGAAPRPRPCRRPAAPDAGSRRRTRASALRCSSPRSIPATTSTSASDASRSTRSALSVRPLARGGMPAIAMRSGDFGDVASIVEMNRLAGGRVPLLAGARPGLRPARDRAQAPAGGVRRRPATARSSSSSSKKAAAPPPTSSCSRSASS